MQESLKRIHDRLFAHYGPQHWWPGDSPFEIMVGAVLTQNTNWKNVARAIENLREAGVLDLHQMDLLAHEELAELIRPAGYYRLKAGRLRNLLRFVVDRYEGSLDAMFRTPLDELRSELLGINGIGPETADSILLYAGRLPTFVVDTYTKRVFKRHGWIEFDADYHTIEEHFQNQLEPDVALYNEYHALIVRVGNEFCGKTPRCERCPLRVLLPEAGPLEPS